MVLIVSIICGLKVHALLHEAGEGGEVALYRCVEKRLLRLYGRKAWCRQATRREGAPPSSPAPWPARVAVLIAAVGLGLDEPDSSLP